MTSANRTSKTSRKFFLLHRTLDSREFEIMAMIDAAAALTCQTHSLDEQHRKLKETESETVKNHKDRSTFTLKQWPVKGSPRKKPHPTLSLPSNFIDDSRLICWDSPGLSLNLTLLSLLLHWILIVQGLQLKLYDHEWLELKDNINEYEYADLPWSQTVQELCGDPSLEHEDDGW
ncbi:hypothetical protein BS47DRAFT_1365090 [Hydnum rufescens UP504]|uniref:Uncharacterized protein n=1 Tax=Hydnum rufescens UP504 TaxID=1448309 RepID=A0A9P6DSN1_9AGAM|nr:hypothetical protein BS47DRAFT_1365090 [Hydnum rufescens UP504]